MDPVVRAASLRGWSSLVRGLGGDPGALLAAARLHEHALDDEDALVPAWSAVRLLEFSAVALDCPDFGLRMANAQDPTALGPLALVAQNAPTVREMVDSGSRYLFVHSQSVAVSLIPGVEEFPGHTALQLDLQLVPRPPARQAEDLGLATAHRLLAQTLADRYRPRAVLLPHTPAAPLSRYVRFFGAEVRPERAFGALIISDALLDLSLEDVDETIRRIAISYLDTHYPPAESTIESRVLAVMSQIIGHGEPVSLEHVARALAVHPRTLQRRLADEGVGFDQLRDVKLRELARQYLTESTIPLPQVARALGFSEQSGLTRACKRWFGRTPTQMRRSGRVVQR